jgi:hypothetical protein
LALINETLHEAEKFKFERQYVERGKLGGTREDGDVRRRGREREREVGSIRKERGVVVVFNT